MMHEAFRSESPAPVMRILLVEDDAMIGASLKRGLRDEGYAVDWVRDGVEAIAALSDAGATHVVVLLDWNLPHCSGLDVLKHMRASGISTPVLMLTARSDLEDRVAGLDTGADDYLVKPFELAELKARLRSLLRRREGRPATQLAHAGVVLDPVTHSVLQAGVPVQLTAREFSLLRAFMEQPSAVLSRAQLEEKLYGWDDAIESNAVEFMIHSVRKKLGAAFIENVRGVGWRLKSDG